MPSASEVEEHRKTHIPYRSWCPECVMGRGLGEQRRCHAHLHHAIPRVGIDYWYITSGGLKTYDELEYGESDEGKAKFAEDRKKGIVVKCLIVRCHESKAVFAHVVPCKGSDEDKYAVDLVCSDVAWMGHTKLLLKSDNEKALLTLVKQALRAIRCNVDAVDKVSDEQSQEYESASNGGTEVGIKVVRGQFRTLKLCLEKRVGHTLPPKHPLTAWLIEHAAFLLNVCHRGPDGLTAWARLRGREFGLNIYAVGERVFWKQPPKGPQHDTEGNMGPRLFPGVLVGYHRASNSYRVATGNGFIVKSRALQSRPLEERWDADALKTVVSTPWNLREVKGAQPAEVGPRVEPHAAPAPDEPPRPRRLKLTKQILEKYGYTENCEQCIHTRAFGETKGGVPHTEACRQRINEAMKESLEGQAKLKQQEEKMVRATYRASGAAESGEPAMPAAPTRPLTELPEDPPSWPAATAVPSQPVDDGMGGMGETTSPTAERRPADEDHEDHEMGVVAPVATSCPSSFPTTTSGVRTIAETCARKYTINDILNGTEQPPENDDICGDEETLMLINAIGIDAKSYRRERNRAFRRIVSEIYSPPRVTRVLSSMPGHGCSPGFALDITCTDPDDGMPWDFDKAEKREKARRLLRMQKPLFLVGSPMCTAWCTWQRLNALRRSPEVTEEMMTRARVHLAFVASLYREQVEGGRFFLHGHPRSASS